MVYYESSKSRRLLTSTNGDLPALRITDPSILRTGWNIPTNEEKYNPADSNGLLRVFYVKALVNLYQRGLTRPPDHRSSHFKDGMKYPDQRENEIYRSTRAHAARVRQQ
jgi:hypothetical protein